jgi:hypothetical protein
MKACLSIVAIIVVSFTFIPAPVSAQQAIGEQVPGTASPSITNDRSPIIGNWTGSWISGGSGGLQVTILQKEDGTLGGTLVATGTEKFGSDLKSLRNVAVNGQQVKFTADSSRYGPWQVELKLSKDGRSMEGAGSFNGYPSGVSLKNQ